MPRHRLNRSEYPSGARWTRTVATVLACGFLHCTCAPLVEAGTFVEWQYRQEIPVTAPGLVSVELPPETLDAARIDLRDLRIVEATGREVPYVIDRGDPTPRTVREAKAFRASLEPTATILTIETGTTAPLEGIVLTTPATTFIKAARVDGSLDGTRWQPLATGLPIYRQQTGAGQLDLSFAAGAWAILRITIDDQRSPPVPFTGAQVRVAARGAAARVPVDVRVVEQLEGPGETRLALDLGAAHLRLASVSLDTSDAMFTRRLSLVARQIEGESVQEKTLGEGVIARGLQHTQATASQLAVPLDVTTPSRHLVLLVRNEDSPPLHIAAVKLERRPVHLRFLASRGEAYSLFSGNPRAAAPQYDLASLAADVRAADAALHRPMTLTPNPDYQPAPVVPLSAATGPRLDVSPWIFRKPVQTTGTNMQSLELDPDVLSHMLPSGADLRLMGQGQQLPYIGEQTSATRALVPELSLATETRTPRISRWRLKLSHRNLPLMRLACTTAAPLFRREVQLLEDATDARGGTFRRHLGSATWSRTPALQTKDLLLTLNQPPTTDALLLELQDEDNAPITLDSCRVYYRIRRLHFSAAPETFLYYGNARAEEPRYDLRLITGQVLTSDHAVASLGTEEKVGTTGWSNRIPIVGHSGIIFWATLAVVALGLLAIIARLLPKPTAPDHSTKNGKD